MTKSLFILMLVGFMISVGLYYDQKSDLQSASELESMIGTAVLKESSQEGETFISGVNLDALDTHTRAQDDFYQFANGGWLDSTEIPTIYSGYTVYHQVNEDAEKALRTIIEKAAQNRTENGSESQQVGDIYNSWMDEETINSSGIEPVRQELDMVASINSAASLVRTMAELKRRGISTPLEMRIYPNMKDSVNYAVYFQQSGITMPSRDYYIELENINFSTARDALPAYIASMLVASGQNPTDAAAAAKGVFAIENAIAHAQWSSVDNRDPDKIYNPYAIAELTELGENIDWSALRNTLGIAGTDTLIIKQPSYFTALDQMILEFPLPDWRAYLAFRVLDSHAAHLDQTTADIRFAYRNRILNGQQEPRPRWKRGISMVNGMVGEAVGKLYVGTYFPPEAKAKMEEMVQNVIATLDESLGELEWMSTETRVMAQKKLSKFTAKIGYPDEWKDYSNLEIVAGNHMRNRKHSIEWKHQRDIGKLGSPVDKNEWHMTPQTVNAYYSPTQNEIVFPAARLQPPFFQLGADDAINYGAVGGVIGHEISHGFDDSGSKFDGDGNLKNWWTEADRNAFELQTERLVRQYSAFEPIEGMAVNGELTLGENIGDLSGVTMAYRAYIKSLGGVEPPVIDGFTGPQRFFIGYAMSRKGKYQEESAISRLSSDPHSPLKYRVIGPYRNIDAFHQAFGSKEGDGMWLSTEERVRLW
jgi:putative endopeptidase